MQVAWFNHLSIVRGAKEAAIFKDLIISLQQSSDLVAEVKQHILARKAANTHVHTQPPPPAPPPPFLQNIHCPPPPTPAPPTVSEKPPILAQDLEAMMLRESRPFLSASYLASDALLEDPTPTLNEVLKNDPILSEILHQESIFINLHFGRKFFRQIFILKLQTSFHPNALVINFFEYCFRK
jgi:hypothetical protein